MEAIGEAETVAAAVGIHVTRFKLATTTLFIIFLPAGIYGSARDLLVGRRHRAPARAAG